MRSILWLTMSGSLAWFFVVTALAAEFKASGLTLKLDDQIHVTGLAVSGAELKVTPGPLVTLCDVSKGQYVAGKPTGGSLDKGLALDFGEARAKATLTVVAKGGALRFACDLKGDDLPARGMLLRFAFPFDATGWLWHQDMQTAKPIAESKVYENVVPLRAYADLPEWRDKPALRMGYSSRNYCTVLTSVRNAT
ncbi:MAG: hypothetical protein FJ272_11400, partial [Planctomycetes bacterium]|nr:hypothetical protein [Planctomycetota bacterium]